MRQQEKTNHNEEQTTRAKILVVEDEPNMVAGLRDNFEFEGYDSHHRKRRRRRTPAGPRRIA